MLLDYFGSVLKVGLLWGTGATRGTEEHRSISSHELQGAMSLGSVDEDVKE